MEKGGSEQIFPHPEHLQQIREEIAGLRARRVSAAVRERSAKRRAVTVGREPLGGCLRKLGQARRGWEALLAAKEARTVCLPDEEAQEKLLNFLDQGLALLGRIETLKSSRRSRRGSGKGPRGPEGGGQGVREAPSASPSKMVPEVPNLGQAETREMPSAGADPTPPVVAGGGREDETYYNVFDADGPQLKAFSQESEVLQKTEESLVHIANAKHKLRVTQVDLSHTLNVALQQKVGSALEGTLSCVPAEKMGEWQEKVGALKVALWGFLWEDSGTSQALQEQMGIWKEEAEDLQEKLLALNQAPSEEEKSLVWREMSPCGFLGNGLLKKASEVEKAVAALQEALRESPQEEVVGAVQEALGALRRGPLEGLSLVWEKQIALENILWSLWNKEGVPPENELGVLYEKVHEVVEAMTCMSLEEVGALQEKVGNFLGARGKSSREIIIQLGIPLKEMDAMKKSQYAMLEALGNIFPSEKDMAALSQKVGAMNGSLRTAGLDEVVLWEWLETLHNSEQVIPLKEVTDLGQAETQKTPSTGAPPLFLPVRRGALQKQNPPEVQTGRNTHLHRPPA